MDVMPASYDAWKTNERRHEVEYRAQAALTLTVYITTEGAFVQNEAPRSHDELYQTIVDDMRSQAYEFVFFLNRKFSETGLRHYNAEAYLEELNDVSVLEQRGSWA